MTELRLFDLRERSDSQRASRSEKSFHFLNRVDTAFWTRVRDLLDEWFADYATCASPAKAADLRARFRKGDPKQHEPAWWELYVFRFLRVQYPDARVVIESPGAERSTSPDFSVLDDDDVLLHVEAVAPFSGIPSSDHVDAGDAFLLDAIDSVESENFGVMVESVESGSELPKRREIVLPIERWLASLDRQAVVEAARGGGHGLPTLELRARGWRTELRALPRTPTKQRRHGLIVAGPAKGGFVNDVTVLRSALVRKAGHYGRLDCPYVIAARPSSPFFSTDSALDVLYGSEAFQFDPRQPERSARLVRQEDGFWSQRYARVSGVIIGAGIFPWTIANVWPQLWANPLATHPLHHDALSIPRAHVEGHESITWVGKQPDSPAAFFDLAPDWPGPDLPFPDDRE